MNRLERLVYDFVKDNPVLKQRIVDAYQAALACVPQRSLVTRFPVTDRPGHFFGFHDKTPFSADGSRLLAHRNVIGDRLVREGDPVEVGFFDGPDWSQYRCVGRSTAWNWQLASMLQWFDARGTQLVHNDIHDGQLVAVVRDLSGQRRDDLPFPVVHVSPGGRLACTYDFLRVEAAMPGYGVVHGRGMAPRETPSFRVFDTATGLVRFELSLEQIRTISPHPSMEGAFHFFHHALFNPSGHRLFFLHRWVDRNQRLWTRMFSVDADGSDLYLFPMDEVVSHITWASDSEVFTYARYPGIGDGYFLVEDRTGKAHRYLTDALNSDGHPTMDRRRGVVLTDTYPDRFRNQYLVLALLERGSCVTLCRTHLPRRFRRELRVDLHPRLHPTLPVACFDSGHGGTRSLMTLDFGTALR